MRCGISNTKKTYPEFVYYTLSLNLIVFSLFNILVGNAPEMLRKLKPIKCLTGDVLEFVCEIDLGTPTADVTWERQGRTIRPNERVFSAISGHQVVLTIKNCSLEDVGTYTVRASNKLGTVESQADLTINSRFTPFINSKV